MPREHSNQQLQTCKWDASLALSAQKIVNKCSNGFSETSGVGENVFRLWSFAPPVNLDYLGVVASKSWEKEFQTFGWTSLLFDRKTSDSHIGHATQMAWAETNMMGCGVKNCKKRSEHVHVHGQEISLITISTKKEIPALPVLLDQNARLLPDCASIFSPFEVSV
ncbi:unnamed protein product [Caenorhabditis nigoni]